MTQKMKYFLISETYTETQLDKILQDRHYTADLTHPLKDTRAAQFDPRQY